MAEIVKNIKVGTAPELYRDDRNAVHPVKKHSMTLCHRYRVGVDFASGDSLTLVLSGAKQILFAIAKTPSNTIIALTESGTAPSLALSTATATTDVEIFVIYTV